jgi:localization factor PodJL
MAETPQLAEAATDDLAAVQDGPEPAAPQAASQASVLPPPANDLGPLLNLPVPSLPVATADALPETIGSPRLRVAAASGDPAAAFEIATRFMEGRSVTQDLGAAAHWYGRAADGGVIPAAYRLGSFYEQGRGVDRDRNSAIAWYERAALGGNPRAMHNLAVMAAEGGGQSPDFARAAGWFIPAANRGLADSQFNLAVLYARGMGVERDLMESYKWFALAANAGDNEAVARRDEVAGVLGEQALALARARVDNWRPVPVETAAVSVQGPAGGWDDSAESASATPTQRLIAEAQALLAERGYNPGPADGLLGPRTNEAVRAFRQSVGLGDSDTIDQALLDALRQGRSL